MKKSEYNDIDGLFQNHLDNYKVAVVDRDALWQRIDEKPDRRRFFFLILVGIIGACGLLLSSNEVYMASGGGAKANGVVMADLNRDASQQKLSEKTITSQELSQELSQEHQTAQELNISFGVNEAKKSELVSEVEPIVSTSINTTNMSAPLENTSAWSSTSSLSDDLHAKTPKTINKSNSLASTPPSVKTKKREAISNVMESAPRSYNTTFFSLLDSYLLSLDNQLPDLPMLKNGRMDKCLVGNSQGGPYLDLYTNAFMPFDNVSLNSGFDDQLAYLDTWQERNKSLLSISGGLSVGYEFNNGLDVSVGVEYQKMESQYQYTQTINEITTVFDPMAYFFIDDQGQTVWVADSVTAINRYDRIISVGSSTTFVNVPLQVSYPLIRKGPWEVKAAVAGILNVSVVNKGQFLRNDLMLQPIDASNESSFFRSSIGVSYELGVHFGYHLNEHLELYASTRFRYNPNSYLVNTSPLSLSRSFGGLRFGTQYHF